ncbi:MAG: S8 family peptidase [Prevotella sp.]|nr:S8 family peptidase [Prevotella sp.]
MKLRNFANRFLLVILLAVFCCGLGANVCPLSPVVVTTAETSALAAKTYYLDQFNDNAPTDENLYTALGIPSYHDYLTALSATQDLAEIIIAVIDTGLDVTHPLFAGRVLTDYAMDFSQGVTNGQPNSGAWYEDHNGHGTHVAGIVADTTLDNVKILPIKIFYGLDNKSQGYTIENAVRYLSALKNGTTVRLWNDNNRLTSTVYNQERAQLNIVAVNMSLGTSGYNLDDTEAMAKYQSEKLNWQDSIDLLLQADILPLVAAGNISTEENANNTYYALPGACEGVVTVAAYDNTDASAYQLASFSYHNDHIAVAAPGAEIWSACSRNIAEIVEKLDLRHKTAHQDDHGTYYECRYGSTVWRVRLDADGNYYLRSGGTSQATPFVTACYALLVSDTSKTTAEDYGLATWDADGEDAGYVTMAQKALLAAAATYGDQGEAGYDEYFGYGVVTMKSFAVDTITTKLNAIENKITRPRTTSHTNDDETDWIVVVCVLLLGAVMIWSIDLFRSYLNRRRKTNDDGYDD